MDCVMRTFNRNVHCPVIVAVVVALAGCSSGNSPGSVDVPGDGEKSPHMVLTRARANGQGLVMLFHQAGSNMHEFDPIVPRLNALDYDTLAVDLRSGGTMWGHDNLTAREHAKDPGYSAAYPDMVAALKFAEEKGYPRIVALGSSYSAALVFRLAAEHSTVSAVVAFSPSEYLDVRGEVAKWNSLSSAPTLIAATKEEIVGGVLRIYESAPRIDKRAQDRMVSFPGGVHGASTLRRDKNPDSDDEYWAALEAFLESSVPR